MVSIFCFFGNLMLGLRDDKLEDRSALVFTPPAIPEGKNAFESLRKNSAFQNLNQDYEIFSKSPNQTKQDFINNHAEAYQTIHEIIASDQVVLGNEYHFERPRIFDLIRLEARHLSQQENYDQALKIMIDLDHYLTRMIRCDHTRPIGNYTYECTSNARLKAQIISRVTNKNILRAVIDFPNREDDWRNLAKMNILYRSADFEKSLKSSLKGDYYCNYFSDTATHLRFSNGLFLKKNRALNAQRELALNCISLTKHKSGVEFEDDFRRQYLSIVDSTDKALFKSLLRLNLNGEMASFDWVVNTIQMNTLFHGMTLDAEIKIIAALRLYELEAGKIPENLERLSPGYMTEIPLNPINLKPFIYSAKCRQIHGLDARAFGTSLSLFLRLEWEPPPSASTSPSSPKPSAKIPLSSLPQKSSP